MLTPLPANQWDRAKAAHLLNRAGFGGPPEEIDALAGNGMAYAIHRLVDGPAAPVAVPAPEWAQPRDLSVLREKVRTAMMNAPADDEAARRQARFQIQQEERRTQQLELAGLGDWWLQRMQNTPDPLEEKLTLFWHGHFATSAQKVRDSYLMWRQNQTFRENARGNFGYLTKAMSRDPAMIHWLDLQQSRAQHANENFARELMELFTLGEGNYTEKDVTESARAFTGYRIDPRNEGFIFQANQHDPGVKQFLNRTGNFDGDNIIDIILEQPACAQFIASKLWTFFASENPAPATVATLAATLRGSRYEMRPVLRAMFTSAEFYAPDVINSQIKSPVQWMVQTARELHGELPPTGQALAALRSMGQLPFVPPSVKGWDGGKAWISTSTLLTRYNFSQAMLHGPGGIGTAGGVNLRALLKNKGSQQERMDGLLMAAMSGGGEEGSSMSAPVAGPAAAAAESFGAGVNGMSAVPLPAFALKPAVAATGQQRVDLQKLVPDALRTNPDAVLRSLTARLFQGPVPPKNLEAFRDYLRSAAGTHITDQTLYELLHLMMSTPAYQLC